jgi:hypothetical protein
MFLKIRLKKVHLKNKLFLIKNYSLRSGKKGIIDSANLEIGIV